MSVENAGSMPFPAGDMSMPLPAGDMSMPIDANDMSMPLPAGDMSMPLDAGMSFPLDAGMSFPLDADMSMPLDEAMMSLDTAMSLTMGTEPDEDACDDETNPSTSVPKSFEVDGPIGILSDILTAAVQEDFTLCPSSRRMLWEIERTMEESVVLGVKVDGVTADVDASCTSGAADDCEVATAEFEVIHKEGTSSQVATDEFLAKLSDRLAEVDGVREHADTSSSPDSSSNPGATPLTTGTPKEGMSGGEKAMTTVLSVAAVAVVLVLVQKKLSKKKRDDDKSVDGSISTAQNSSAYDTSLSIF